MLIVKFIKVSSRRRYYKRTSI